MEASITMKESLFLGLDFQIGVLIEKKRSLNLKMVKYYLRLDTPRQGPMILLTH